MQDVHLVGRVIGKGEGTKAEGVLRRAVTAKAPLFIVCRAGQCARSEERHGDSKVQAAESHCLHPAGRKHAENTWGRLVTW